MISYVPSEALLVEAAARSVLLAASVWIGLRVFAVRNVLAQKAAWGVVLGSALAMPVVLPMAAHWSILPASVRIVLPVDPQNLLEELQAGIQAKSSPEAKPEAVAAEPSASQAKPAGILAEETTGNRAADRAEPNSPKADIVKDAPPQAVARNEAVPEESTGARQAPAPEIGIAPKPSAVPERATLSLPAMVLLLYLAVTGVLLIRLVCGFIAALRLLSTATPIAGDLVTAVGADVDVAHSGDVRCSTRVSSPVTICSSIVLPADYASWDAEKLRIVLAHERSHIRQGDFYLQLLAGMYAAAVWFSPLGWWLKHKLSDLAEAISDRAGLEEAADRTSYAQILLEFAASPRPTLIGVAMARSGSLSRRIERLLNDASFRQAFAGTRRALVAVVVIPVALFVATALVRVQAAGQQAPAPPSMPAAPPAGVAAPNAPASPETGISTPEQISGEPGQEPAPPPEPAAAPAPPAQAGVPEHAAPLPEPAHFAAPPTLAIAPVPAHVVVPPIHVIALPAHGTIAMIAPKAPGSPSMILLPKAPGAPGARMAIIGPGAAFAQNNENGTVTHSINGKHSGYRYSYSSNGESYAIIRGGDTEHMTFSGDWIEGRRELLEKARKQAGGKDILWFTRDGKSYFVDDPATLTQIEAMYKPMEELGRQQEELGKKQEVLGKQQEELGHQQESASVPTPDMSKEIAEIEAAMAKLKASQGKSMTQEQFGEIQEKLGDLQGRLGEIQGQIGSKQGEFGSRMGELGSKMGELGSQMGRLGEQQGKIAQEADRKVKSIIDESLKNGKAHPVQ